MWNNNTDVWKRWASEVGIPSGLTDASNDDEWGEIKRKKKQMDKALAEVDFRPSV